MLTKAVADKTVWNGTKSHVIKDEVVSGLYFRVNRDSKSFFVRFSFQGRQVSRSIGQYGIVTLDQARQIARKLLGKVAEGIDPTRTDDQKPTFQTLIDKYLELHAKPHKESWEHDQWRIKNHVPNSWKSRPLVEISRMDVTELLKAVGKKHPITSNRLARLLSKMFECAREWGMFPENQRNPAEKIKLFKETQRDRYVKTDEMPGLIAEINAYPIPQVRNTLWMIILTGCRKTEILSMKWEDVDLKRKELRVPKTKSGKVHYVPLSERAVEILQSISTVKGNPYVMTGRWKGHYQKIDKQWAEIRKNAKMKDIHIHDLRRTVGSWLANQGKSLHIIGRLLNQSSPKVTEIYARLADKTKREAIDNYTEELLEVISKKENE